MPTIADSCHWVGNRINNLSGKLRRLNNRLNHFNHRLDYINDRLEPLSNNRSWIVVIRGVSRLCKIKLIRWLHRLKCKLSWSTYRKCTVLNCNIRKWLVHLHYPAALPLHHLRCSTQHSKPHHHCRHTKSIHTVSARHRQSNSNPTTDTSYARRMSRFK